MRSARGSPVSITSRQLLAKTNSSAYSMQCGATFNRIILARTYAVGYRSGLIWIPGKSARRDKTEIQQTMIFSAASINWHSVRANPIVVIGYTAESAINPIDRIASSKLASS